MRKLLTLCSLLLLFAVVSAPQAYSQVELYGGYSHLGLSGTPSNIGSGSNGWQGGIYLHLMGPFGAEADFSNHYGVSPRIPADGSRYYVPRLTKLYGPRFTLSLPRIHPFVHALFGTVHGTAETASGSLTEDAFGLALGGGVNVKATRHVWLRLIQVDYLRAQFSHNGQNDTRISAGLVFRFGQW